MPLWRIYPLESAAKTRRPSVHTVSNITVFSPRNAFPTGLEPAADILIDGSSIPDCENFHLEFDNPENNPVTADPQLPVSFQILTQRFSVFVGGYPQALFNGLSDPIFRFSVDERQVLGTDSRGDSRG